MSLAVEDIYRIIDEKTALCVEQKRNRPFFQFAWLRSRQSFEPGCRSQVTAQYQQQLTEAQQARYEQETALFNAANEELQGGDNNRIITIIIIVLIAMIIIAWILS